VTRKSFALKASGANVFFNGGTPKFVAQGDSEGERARLEAGRNRAEHIELG